LRGENAQSEARAAGDDVEVTRLQLIESTRAAFYDYYLAERALHVNREGLGLLQELRKDANARYKADTAPEQDYLLADVEIGRQRERQLALERSREVAIARINMLMHQPPDQRLPPPPTELKPGPIPSNTKELREVALSRRPDLRAVANRLEAERAALALAEREYKPDFEAVAAYDTWWQSTDRDLRPMVGLRMNVPVRYARRDGAIAEAAAKLAQRRAEYDRLTDQTNYEVQQAIAQLNESARAARLYQETILPAARENVRAARAGYAATKIPAVSLIEAQRNLIMQRERSYEVIADFFRRQAALERAIGGPVPDSERERLLVPKEPTAP
jgi:outer membrane protein TolC